MTSYYEYLESAAAEERRQDELERRDRHLPAILQSGKTEDIMLEAIAVYFDCEAEQCSSASEVGKLYVKWAVFCRSLQTPEEPGIPGRTRSE